MQKYRKKPVVIEAVRFTEANADEVSRELIAFARTHGQMYPQILGLNLIIHTLEGAMTANPGDWIIRGVKNELYPCKPDIFEATYEPATEVVRPVPVLCEGCRMPYAEWAMEGQEDEDQLGLCYACFRDRQIAASNAEPK